MSTKSPGKDYRLVLEVNETPYGRGSCSTEKFTIPDNSHISWTCFKKGIRLFPPIPRSSTVKLYLRDPETRRLQKNSMLSYKKGKIIIRGNDEGSTVIHRGRTYYLDIRWGSRVKKFGVRVEEPVN